jgi:hypothetical protein
MTYKTTVTMTKNSMNVGLLEERGIRATKGSAV